MYEINSNVVYVKGYKNGAIYNLNDGNVYSINAESCGVLEKAINSINFSEQEKEYINLLQNITRK